MKNNALLLIAFLALTACQAGVSELRHPQAEPAVEKVGEAHRQAPVAGDFAADLVGPGTRFPIGSPGIHVLEAAGTAVVSGTLAGTGSLPVPDALLYFTDDQARFYVVRAADDPKLAALVAPQTDASGSFVSLPVFPAGTPVIANAILPGNRRLAGLAVAGESSASISPGSTYVTEFLKFELGTAFLGDPAVWRVAASEGTRASELIRSGTLQQPGDSDLVIGGGTALAVRYISQALVRDAQSVTAWDVLTPHVRALTTFAGTFLAATDQGSPSAAALEVAFKNPRGLAVAPGSDTIVIADKGADLLKVVAGGKSYSIVASRGDSRDGTPADGFVPPRPSAVAYDPHGNVAMVFYGDGRNRMATSLGFLCLKAGTYFGRPMTEQTFYQLGSASTEFRDGPLAGAVIVAHGVTFDADGNLYESDHRNRIRRIDAKTGEVMTVLGDGWPFLRFDGGGSWTENLTLDELGAPGGGSATVTGKIQPGRLVDVAAGPGQGLEASFSSPEGLAWRRVGDRQELYILDGFNNAVRRATTSYPGDFRDAAVETVLGSTRSFTYETPAQYTTVQGIPGPAQNAPGLSATLWLSRYDPTGRNTNLTLPAGGIALDPTLDRLYVTDSLNRCVRMLDLFTGEVKTVAANDAAYREGNALRTQISDELGGIGVLPDHSVVFVDAGYNVVRRIHLQFGL